MGKRGPKPKIKFDKIEHRSEIKDVRLDVRIPAALKARAAVLADRRGVSVSGLVREYLERATSAMP